MVKEIDKTLTRANVLQIGLVVLLLGAVGYGCFRLIGFEASSAGIASEFVLVLIVFGWTASYLLRVFTGNMTFMEQRKRYRQAYEKVTSAELKARFEAMTEEEKSKLINELEKDSNAINTSSEL